MFTTPVDTLNRCVEFVEAVGIHVLYQKLEGPCFLPGLSIRNGSIVIDREALKYPGDILHEAGHIAVVPANERATLNGITIEKRFNREAEEMMAIAWSYAACIHLDIDPTFVFHDDGYKGGGSYIVDNFKEKKYFGLPMLQWTGMAMDEKAARSAGQSAYPYMIKWLRD
jgi:hypothetical protein